MPSAITPIATITTTTAVNTIVFSSISQAYRDLKIVVRGNMTSTGFALGITLPAGLFHRNYSQARLTGSDPEVGGTNTAVLTGNYSNANGNELQEITIFDYAQTDKFKSFIMMQSVDTGSAIGAMSISIGSHDRTTALTSFTVTSSGTTFAAGFSVSVYGVSV
jgi:hypothetical protein